MARGRHAERAPTDSGRGWVVAIAGCLVNTWTFGVFYSFAAALGQMAEEFDAGLGGVATFFAVTTFLFFVLGIVAGPIADRFGARPLVAVGGILMGGGLWLTAQVSSIAMGTVTYGVGVGVGIGAYLVPMSVAVGGWFERQRSLALGVNTLGIGLGTLVLVPIGERLIASQGWRDAFELMGLGSFVVFGLAALVTFRSPTPAAPFAASVEAARSALAHSAFWRMFFAGLLMSLALFVPFVFLVEYAKAEGISGSAAAWLISSLGVGSVVGRIGLGLLGIRIGVLQLIVMCFAVQPVSYAIWLVAGGNYLALLAFAALLGVGYGGYVALSPVAAAGIFGMYGLGGVLGVMYTSAGIGALVGPVAAGEVIDRTGSYDVAIIASIIVSAAATLVALPLWWGAEGRTERPRLATDPQVFGLRPEIMIDLTVSTPTARGRTVAAQPSGVAGS